MSVWKMLGYQFIALQLIVSNPNTETNAVCITVQ